MLDKWLSVGCCRIEHISDSAERIDSGLHLTQYSLSLGTAHLEVIWYRMRPKVLFGSHKRGSLAQGQPSTHKGVLRCGY